MKQLRILDMSDTGILNLPDCISDLKHLRYLRLERYQITKLPETLGSLYLLETLSLNWTKIKILPDSICFLKRLRYLGLRLHTLDLELCKIDSLPYSISNLSSLRRLICNDEVLCSSEIRKLTNLYTTTDFGNGRHLIVKEFTDLVNVDEAKKKSSHNREHIKVLSLVWNKNKSHMANPIHGDVLESLGRHPNLRQLYMDGFGGNSLSSWLRDPFHLLCLNRIHLIRCEQLTSLPPLENFPHLRHVHIESAKRLKAMGSLFSSDASQLPNKATLQCLSNRNRGHGIQESRVLFRGLLSRNPWKTLIIVDCPNVSYFSVDGFKFIRVLMLIRCPQIQISYLGGLASLQDLSIKASHQDIPTDFSSGGFLQLERLELEDLPNWRSWAGPKEGECPKLQKLSVVGCNSLESFSISCLHSLNDIYVKNCPMLKISRYDREKLHDIEKYCKTNIQDIKIISHGYEALDAMEQSQRLPYSPSNRFWNLSTVDHLVISECTMLVSISSEELPSSLKSIQLDACSNLRYLQLGKQCALEYLSIQNCHQLSHVESISSILRFLLIHSSRRSILCHLGNLTKVEYLSIKKCVLEFSDVVPSTLKVKKIDQSILKVLTIVECSDWTSLPFSSLDSFEELRIIRCSGPAALIDVKWLPSTLKKLEVNEYSNLSYFPLHLFESLKELRIIRWSMYVAFVDGKSVLSTLKKLEIIECSDLTHFPLFLLESLEELRIIRCSDLAGFIDERTVPSTLKKIEIIECGHLTYFPLHLLDSLEESRIIRCSGPTAFIDVKRVPSTLKRLQFVECSDLTYFPLCSLQNLEELSMIRCSNLAIFIDERVVPPTLKKLEIVECDHLTYFPLHLLENLDELRIVRCSGLTALIDTKRVPSTLKKVEIVECSDLTYFPLDFLENLEELRMIRSSFRVAFVDVKRVPSTLKKLEIVEFFDLTYFPLYLLENLEELKMIRCSFRATFIDVERVPSTLKRLQIVECSNLTYFPFHLLENLQEFKMITCSLRDVFVDMKWAPSTMKKLEIITCFDLTSFPRHLLESLEELRIVRASFSTGFIGMKRVLSALKKLEIVECSNFSSFQFT
ncbi:unnamed protein product [Spirodela intermedia]|uniref:R13L1/DRL21-like LRR repeat region domain-containing protein n=1 Tax=Spirodela intermedia TaxID=51605 RepID=A0ABN7EDH8_SPIIN|nr:unnamed protein product [Spirodela intermedia]